MDFIHNLQPKILIYKMKWYDFKDLNNLHLYMSIFSFENYGLTFILYVNALKTTF
jgi:hypothetical protein